MKTMASRAKRAKRRIEDVVQYALGHKTRVYILILLNEGIYTAGELAAMMDEPLNNVHKHLGKMLEDGSVEIAREEREGNITRYWYRAVETQCYSQEEFEQLPFAYRQNIAGAILQSGTAEVMAGFYTGNLADPRACCYWDWYNLDATGRLAAEELNLRYLNELREIEVESTNRAASSGEETTSMLLHNMFFERPRKGLSRAFRFGRSPFGDRGAPGD
ncbi:MAG: Helix-turn-helix domain [Solirubrobacterales bacterium]|nr:Helix-turn-helix domain [Solirubrobacterales bacterium]